MMSNSPTWGMQNGLHPPRQFLEGSRDSLEYVVICVFLLQYFGVWNVSYNMILAAHSSKCSLIVLVLRIKYIFLYSGSLTALVSY